MVVVHVASDAFVGTVPQVVTVNVNLIVACCNLFRCNIRGRRRSGVDRREEQSRVWHADCAGRRRPRGAVRGASPKPPKGDTCGYGPPLGVRSY